MTFCETGGTYDSAQDLTHDFFSRWYNGWAQSTPIWSSDGSHIVFGHAGRVYVTDIRGSDLQSLSGSIEPAGPFSKTAEIDFSPTASPDGHRVAYATLRYAGGYLSEHTYEIATQAIDGSDRQRLTINEWDDVSPAWSPDGSQIAYVSFRKEGARLFTIDPAGSVQRSVAPTVDALGAPPRWSPDGSRLAFLAVERETARIPYLDTYHSDGTPTPKIFVGEMIRYVAYTVGADGSGLTRLEWTNERASSPRTRIRSSDVPFLLEEAVSLPSWSPDGRRLAFSAAFHGDAPAIYVMNDDGSNVARIFANDSSGIRARERFRDLARPTSISWSSDGSEIQFVSGGVPYAVRTDGSALRRLGPAAGAREISWSPDGSKMALLGEDGTLFATSDDWPDMRILAWRDGDRLVAVPPPRPRTRGDVSRSRLRSPADRSLCTRPPTVPDPESNPGLVQDCETLRALRDALAGNAALNWNIGIPIDEWRGVRTGGEPPRVTSLWLNDRLLTGTIPGELANLTELRGLSLGGNLLAGSIPQELGELSRLRSLDLSSNYLTGPIPSELGNLAGILSLELNNNGLSGRVPSELSKLTGLRELNLSANLLSGGIPGFLGSITSLEHLDLSENNLGGEIPSDLGALVNLKYLDMSLNQLEGRLPAWLADLYRLEEVDLSYNDLTGGIPLGMNRLGLLKRLDLSGNDLSGCVPGEPDARSVEVDGLEPCEAGSSPRP